MYEFWVGLPLVEVVRASAFAVPPACSGFVGGGLPGPRRSSPKFHGVYVRAPVLQVYQDYVCIRLLLLRRPSHHGDG